MEGMPVGCNIQRISQMDIFFLKHILLMFLVS